MRFGSYILPHFKIRFLNEKTQETALLDELVKRHSYHTANIDTVNEITHLNHSCGIPPGNGDDDNFMACSREISDSYEMTEATKTSRLS